MTINIKIEQEYDIPGVEAVLEIIDKDPILGPMSVAETHILKPGEPISIAIWDIRDFRVFERPIL